MPNGLTPDQIETLAQSIASHAAGDTYGTGHLDDFGVSTKEELVDLIKQMLNDPNTKFFQNTTDDALKGGSVVFFNEETKSFLVFNPNQLQDPKFDEVGKVINEADNFAGTFFRSPGINADGQPVSKNSGRVLTDSQSNKAFKGALNNVLNQVARPLGITRDQIEVRTIGESDVWAEQIARHDGAISQGLEEGTARIEAGEFDNARGAPDAPKPNVPEPAEVVANDGTRTTAPDAPGSRVADNLAEQGDEVLDLARRSEDVADLMKGARAGRLGKLGIVTTVGVTVGVAALIHHAFNGQRDLAKDLLDNGSFGEGPEAQAIYEEYIELNESIETKMQAENVAGQGWLFLATTPAVELDARAQFEEFSRKHNLPEDVHQALGMSMFDGQSLRGEFAEEAAALIPQDMGDFPPELHGLWRAKQEMEDAQGAYDRAQRSGGRRRETPSARAERIETREERRQEASRDLSGAQAAYQREFAQAFSNPETAKYLMDQMEPDTLLEMVTATAQYNADGKHPLIQEMAEMQAKIEAGDSGWIFDSDSENRLEEIQDQLKANPQLMHDYIAEVFAGRVEPNSIPQAQHEINAPVQQAFTAMPEFMQNRAIETAALSIDLKGDMEGVHPYMKDLAELYQNRDDGGLRGGASTRDRANARIDEIEQEIRNHPEIMGEFAAQNPEIQNVINEYQQNKPEMDQLAAVPDARMDSVLLHIRQTAENNQGAGFEAEHPLVQRLAALHDRRDEVRGGRGATFTRKNIDAEIKQIQEELRENPDILSDYGERKMGDDLIPDNRHGSLHRTPDAVIDRTSQLATVLPSDASITVQSSDNNASVARGVVADDQIRLMQDENKDPVTLPEVAQQRELQAQQELQRQQELVAQQAEQQRYLERQGQPSNPTTLPS